MRKLTMISMVLVVTVLLIVPSFSVVADEGVPWFDLIPYLLTGGPPDDTPPSANFSAELTSGEAPLTVEFNAFDSEDADGLIDSYNWDFDDGFSGTGIVTSHEFQTYGEYKVELTVVDNDGASATATTTISVYSSSSISKEFNWRYDDSYWKWVLSVPESEYHYWDNKDSIRNEMEILKNNIQYVYSNFVKNERDDQYFSKLVNLLKDSMGDKYHKTVEDALYFARKGINYTKADSYVKYPIETLIEGGDCEDQAIFYTSLVKELGYGALLIGLQIDDKPVHMIAGVPVNKDFIDKRSKDYKFWYVFFDGKYYAYADPGPEKFSYTGYDRLGEGDYSQYDTNVLVWDVSTFTWVKVAATAKP